MGPIYVGRKSPTGPVRHCPDLVAWIGRPHAAGALNAWDASEDASEVRRSVAARPPSRLLTGTSFGSEPVALTVPVWWQRQDFWDAGLTPSTTDLETERQQSPIRGLAQPRGCSRAAKFSPPPLGASSFQQTEKKQTEICHRPRCALLTLEAIKRFGVRLRRCRARLQPGDQKASAPQHEPGA